MLAIPFELPGLRLDRERRVRIERGVLHPGLLRQEPVHLRDPRIGLAGAVEHKVLLSIVAPGNPGRRAETAFYRQPVPSVEVRIAGLRDSVHAPQLGAGLHVVPGDEATTGRGIAAAGRALDQDAVGDERTTGEAP